MIRENIRSDFVEMKRLLDLGLLSESWEIAGRYSDEDLLCCEDTIRKEWIDMRQEILRKMINELKLKT